MEKKTFVNNIAMKVCRRTQRVFTLDRKKKQMQKEKKVTKGFIWPKISLQYRRILQFHVYLNMGREI